MAMVGNSENEEMMCVRNEQCFILSRPYVVRNKTKGKRDNGPKRKAPITRLRAKPIPHLLPRMQRRKPIAPPRCDIDLRRTKFVYERVLTDTDFSSHLYITVPEESAKEWLPAIEKNAEIWIYGQDLSERKVWSFKYKIWKGARGPRHVLGVGDFIKKYNLVKGDVIIFWRDESSDKYVISWKKASEDS